MAKNALQGRAAPPSPPFGRSHRLGLPMVVCVECLPVDKPCDVVSVTRRSSGVAPRACVRVYARVLVPPNLYIHTYTYGCLTITRVNRTRPFQSEEVPASRGFLLLCDGSLLVYLDHAHMCVHICMIRMHRRCIYKAFTHL